jgi:hypothetical protein
MDTEGRTARLLGAHFLDVAVSTSSTALTIQKWTGGQNEPGSTSKGIEDLYERRHCGVRRALGRVCPGMFVRDPDGNVVQFDQRVS